MSKVFVADSTIHGRGLFAGEHIRCGAVVGKYTSRKVRLDTDHPHILIVYDLDTGEELERWMGTGNFRYVNHSQHPNLGIIDETLEFFALREIAQGEELLWHYGEEYEEDLRESEEFLEAVAH